MNITEVRPWRERNPMRVWRKANKLTLADACVLLGNGGISTLTKWENGGARPAPVRMERLAEVMKDGGIARKWDSWLEEAK
jgi:transcriptional regulator with XRE-family HTH domain